MKVIIDIDDSHFSSMETAPHLTVIACLVSAAVAQGHFTREEVVAVIDDLLSDESPAPQPPARLTVIKGGKAD